MRMTWWCKFLNFYIGQSKIFTNKSNLWYNKKQPGNLTSLTARTFPTE